MLRPMHGSQRLAPEIVLRAYAEGVFPMAERREDPELYWVSPVYLRTIRSTPSMLPKRFAYPSKLLNFREYERRHFASVLIERVAKDLAHVSNNWHPEMHKRPSRIRSNGPIGVVQGQEKLVL